MEVSANGDIANWSVPGKMLKGMGGAMDLVAGVKRVIVIMEHVTREGQPKLMQHCTLPLTGTCCVDMVITDRAVFDLDPGGRGLTLIELAPGVELLDLQAITAAPFSVKLPVSE